MNSTPVSTQVTRRIKEGQEEAFEASLRDFFQRAIPIPGQLSVNVIKPVAGSSSREWGILRTFESERFRDEFFASDLFKEYDEHVSQFTDGPRKIEHICGLETWFTVGGSKAMVPPPRWKMAIVTFLGVYLTSNAIGLTLGKWLLGVTHWLASAVSAGLTVVCLTWLVMPVLARLFHAWLYPRAT